MRATTQDSLAFSISIRIVYTIFTPLKSLFFVHIYCLLHVDSRAQNTHWRYHHFRIVFFFTFKHYWRVLLSLSVCVCVMSILHRLTLTSWFFYYSSLCVCVCVRTNAFEHFLKRARVRLFAAALCERLFAFLCIYM